MVRKEFLQQENPQTEQPTEEDKPQAKEPKVYVKPVCVGVEEMFNTINDKLDFIVNRIASGDKNRDYIN